MPILAGKFCEPVYFGGDRMASNRQKLKRIEKRKAITRGKARKRLIRAKGSTPPFPVHPDKQGKQVDVSKLELTEQSE